MTFYRKASQNSRRYRRRFNTKIIGRRQLRRFSQIRRRIWGWVVWLLPQVPWMAAMTCRQFSQCPALIHRCSQWSRSPPRSRWAPRHWKHGSHLERSHGRIRWRKGMGSQIKRATKVTTRRWKGVFRMVEWSARNPPGKSLSLLWVRVLKRAYKAT